MLRLFKILLALSCLSSCRSATGDGSAKILQYDFRREGEAQYRFNYETSDGIKREETGDEIPSIHDSNNNAARVRGSFSYPGADGKIYSVTFLADEAGFHPEGEHLMIPPFTPWIPGQPIDDGKYNPDNSGQYKPDNSGRYRPEQGEDQDSPILNQKSPTNPTKSNSFVAPKSPNSLAPESPGFPQNKPGFQQNNRDEPRAPLDSGKSQPSYTSGERILNTFRSTPSTTPKYLPTAEPQKTDYISGENILDTYLSPKKLPSTVTAKYLPSASTPEAVFRESSRVTPKYLPSFSTTTEKAPLDNEIIRKAFFNKPTPHPEILLHSTPKTNQGIL